MIQKKRNDEEFTKKKLLIFDTNIFLTGIDFNLIKGIIYTPPKVIEEITVPKYIEKNRNIINKIQVAIDSKKLILKAASDKYLKEIEYKSKLSGDYNALSDTDKEVLAITLDLLNKDQTQTCLRMIDDRNLTVHTYDEELAEKIFSKIKEYAKIMHILLTRIENKIQK